MMKLSENTINVLKNFATINSGIVLVKGSIQRTRSPEKNILAEAIIDDSFNVEEFGVYDLHRFITNISTLNNPELTFQDLSVLISDGETELTYHGAEPDVILGSDGKPSADKLANVQPDVVFPLSKVIFQQAFKIAALNNLPNISIIGEKGKLYLQAHDRKNDTSNIANLTVCDYDGKDFRATFKADNLKMIPEEYNVAVCVKNAPNPFVLFQNTNKTLKYYVALEKVK